MSMLSFPLCPLEALPFDSWLQVSRLDWNMTGETALQQPAAIKIINME
jgi:hypothetical protein